MGIGQIGRNLGRGLAVLVRIHLYQLDEEAVEIWGSEDLARRTERIPSDSIFGKGRRVCP
jgi:hypothetical protein